MAVDRYMCAIHPEKYQLHSSKKVSFMCRMILYSNHTPTTFSYTNLSEFNEPLNGCDRASCFKSSACEHFPINSLVLELQNIKLINTVNYRLFQGA